MRPLVIEIENAAAPEQVLASLSGLRGVALLRSLLPHAAVDADSIASGQARYSYLTARPLLTFRSLGSRCVVTSEDSGSEQVHFGNPWRILDLLMARYELLDELDLPFPTGGCFGYWGYDLKNFVEPRLPRRAVNDLELPDCHVGFYGSVLVFDHALGKCWIVATGLASDGTRSEARARSDAAFWTGHAGSRATTEADAGRARGEWSSSLSREAFIARVRRAQEYIRSGDIYQVNLSHRISTEWTGSGVELFLRLSAVSPAPFSAFLDCGEFTIASSSPEQFLRLSGSHARTRPIKGTRPRSDDPLRDAQLGYELQSSEKERSELVMITDLLRNDLGRVCEFGTVLVPELMRLERYPHVQHLVSTVEGRLRDDITHFAALAACFPGGSITGAPKIRAMQIIDELEPVSRGPYTGALGYLGFNRESQLSIVIRTAVCRGDRACFNVGAGIVADSDAAAEYDETLSKAAGFLQAVTPGRASVRATPPDKSDGRRPAPSW